MSQVVLGQSEGVPAFLATVDVRSKESAIGKGCPVRVTRTDIKKIKDVQKTASVR